ncbi:MAG: HPr family phosphocarrier protein [Lachnospiraceae bacterium]|nr:HPr family phosphocarrier protein [Lachnospiraceae bacterium]
MKEFTYVITDPVGIHARPAGVLAKQVKGLESKVVIWKGDKCAEAKKLMAVMGLGVKQGDEVKVTVEGPAEEADAATVEAFFKENF